MLDLSGMNRPFCGSAGIEWDEKTRQRCVVRSGTRARGRGRRRAPKRPRADATRYRPRRRVCVAMLGGRRRSRCRVSARPSRRRLVERRSSSRGGIGRSDAREIRRAFASEAAAARERGERAEGGRDVPRDRRAWLRWSSEPRSVGAPREVARRARRVPKSKEKRLEWGNARSAPVELRDGVNNCAFSLFARSERFFSRW
jgi:hypothetical protein